MSVIQPEKLEPDRPESITPETVKPETIKLGFKQIVQDFSHYLTIQKKNSNTGFSISNDSKKNMEFWGSNKFCDPFVFEGSPSAKIYIIDSQGDPGHANYQGHAGQYFKSDGGQLLKKILHAINLTPDQVFICNAVNLEHIQKKTKANSPKVIITLGQTAAQLLLGSDSSLEKLRGRFHHFSGVKVMPTFHPVLLLEKPEYKRQVWEDMKQVMALLQG